MNAKSGWVQQTSGKRDSLSRHTSEQSLHWLESNSISLLLPVASDRCLGRQCGCAFERPPRLPKPFMPATLRSVLASRVRMQHNNCVLF